MIASLKRPAAMSAIVVGGVSAQTVYFSYSKTGFNSTGSWESPNPKVKLDMTETQIDCFREMKTRVIATADNLMGRPHVFTNYMEVIKWDEDRLIATDTSPICMALAQAARK